MTSPSQVERWIDGGTDVFSVLGCPVRHSLSPVMHNAAMQALGMNAVYVPFEVQPGTVADALKGMAALGVRGTNVTVPLKEEVHSAMDELDATAKLFGAVNTVSFTPEGLKGSSTDGVGFIRGFEEAFDVSLVGREVLILGAGGAGRSIALACAQEGVNSLAVYNRTVAKAEDVRREVAMLAPALSTSVVSSGDELDSVSREVDVIVQCTSLGLHEGDAEILATDSMREGQMVYDLIYNRKTPILSAAETAGAKASGGLGMLIHQGVASFEIWTGQTPPVGVMREAVQKAMSTC